MPSNEMAQKLDDTEPGWKISGKYVGIFFSFLEDYALTGVLYFAGGGVVIRGPSRGKGPLRVSYV